jgi:hypothetical protein
MNFYAIDLWEETHEVLSDASHALSLARDLWALVDELLVLLDGLEQALSTRLLDAENRLPAERLDELARMAPALNLSPKRPMIERVYAAEEALSNVQVLGAFLERARRRGDDIVSG